jgi:hypothetical protein
VKEYELYLPLNYNDGSSVEPEQIERVGQLLLKRFGGLDLLPAAKQGEMADGTCHLPRRNRYISGPYTKYQGRPAIFQTVEGGTQGRPATRGHTDC